MISDDIKNSIADIIRQIPNEENLELEDYITCRVENSITNINDIIELRHTPSNSGVTRLRWDTYEKDNFLERIGKSTSINMAKYFTSILIKHGFLDKNERIPNSIFKRLFSNYNFRKRAGFEKYKNEIKYLHEPDAVNSAITRIAKDMIAGKITLNQVWNNKEKNTYLDNLERDGILPSSSSRLDEPKTMLIKENIKRDIKISRPKPNEAVRKYLIPSNIPTLQKNEYFSDKFCLLFHELQNTLEFPKHDISIAIAFRTFLEILTNSYCEKNNLEPHSRELAQLIKYAHDNMHEQENMSEDSVVYIKKIQKHSDYFSINTLHKVVHTNMQISQNDLRTYMNNLEAYIYRAIQDINSTPEN